MQQQDNLYTISVPLQFTGNNPFIQTAEFYKQGFHVAHHLGDVNEAESYINSFIRSLDMQKLPTLEPFKDQIQLGKRNRIPARECPDAHRTPYLGLHYEMGLPFTPTEPECMIQLILALYFPADDAESETQTRLLNAKQLFQGLDAQQVESKLENYCAEYGDGWEEYNSGRLAPLGRVLDAISGQQELKYMRDHRIAEWFQKDAKGKEKIGSDWEEQFFREHKLDLEAIETCIQLKPGDLLLVNNTLVAHGRRGKRRAEEIWQWLYGIPQATAEQVKTFRGRYAHAVTTQA